MRKTWRWIRGGRGCCLGVSAYWASDPSEEEENRCEESASTSVASTRKETERSGRDEPRIRPSRKTLTVESMIALHGD